MNPFYLSWKNLLHKPMTMVLSLVLFALGVGLISLLFLFEKQLQDNFEKNLAGIDLVIGAKGSPLQLITSSMYHIDVPTGNMSLKEARPFLNPKHPLIETAIPLSMGDSYQGKRIVGTIPKILEVYDAKVAKGKVWEQNFEVTIGALLAKDLNLKIGDQFKSSHGYTDDEDLAHEDAEAFKVVGILEATGTVIDQLILTTPQSFWLVHDHDHEEEPATEQAAEIEDHEDHNHENGDGHDHHDGHEHEEGGDHGHHDESEHDHSHDGHDHDHDHSTKPKDLLEEDEEKEITSILLKFKGRNFQALNMGRNINENTDLQAATPAIEINRIFNQLDTGEQYLRILAYIIIFVSGLSVFISLYNSLKDRKYELALMRSMGATPMNLFGLILVEGLLLAILGAIIGLVLSHGGMGVIAQSMKQAYGYSFSGMQFLTQEIFLILGALIIGVMAAILPAIQASQTDIADILTKS